MALKAWLPALLAVTAVTLLAAACANEDPPATRFVPGRTPTPDAQATITAQAQVPAPGTPTPTPVPSQEREVVMAFIMEHDLIARSWDQFHIDLDTWREGLVECDASAVQVDLRRFAADMRSVADLARELPRSPGVRGLADLLIQATELEQAQIRALRDGWSPDDPAAFEAVDAGRAAALSLRTDTQDQLDDLQETTSPSSRRQIGDLSEAVTRLDQQWDGFHDAYDAFRAGAAHHSPLETVRELGVLIDRFRVIVAAIRGLPPYTAAAQAIEALARAAEGEDLALRRIRGTFVRSEEEPAQAGDGPPAEDFVPQDPSLFDAFDVQIVTVNGVRRQAAQALAAIADGASQERAAEVREFAGPHGELVRAWDAFHADYDQWRATEGGCDRSRSIETLGGFALRFRQVATMVRELPRATFLRPLTELLVEAAEREEQVLRTLRNTWRPFDATVYTVLDRERSAAGKLRRQVASGIQDLMPRFNISLQDLKS